jgi:hypothetical protein
MRRVAEDKGGDLATMKAAYQEWLKPAWRVMIVLVAVVAPAVVARFLNGGETRVTWLQRRGLGVQLLGFFTVWKQLRETVARFGHPTLWSRITDWWRAHPPVLLLAQLNVGAD